MNIKDYKILAEDIKLKKGDYENEDLRTFPLFGTWKEFYLKEMKTLNGLLREMKKLKQERTQFYLGKTEVPYEIVVMKSEVGRYLDADPMILDLEEQIDDQKLIVEYVSDMVEAIKRRGFEIKGARQWAMWSNGASHSNFS